MKSIKPGRGPSMMSGIAGIGAVVFGIFWTIMAVQMGAPIFFAAFGIIFIVMAIVGVIYNMHNATGEKRYAAFDIVDEGEEADPLNERFGRNVKADSASQTDAEMPGLQEERIHAVPQGENNFCPYCGAPAKETYTFCRKCGRRLDESAEAR